jgi:hypothetical protein
MFPPYNIFKVQSDGSLRWMESATDLERAKALVKGLAAFSPGEYVITDLKGEEISIKSPHKRIMFQIGYDEKELKMRAQLFRCCGPRSHIGGWQRSCKALFSLDSKC